MKPRQLRFDAFSLVEITLALGVAAVSLLAIFGLLATGSQVNHTAAEQTASTDILMAVANDLRATPSTTDTSLQYGITIPANPVNSSSSTTIYFDSTGGFSTSLTSGSRYRVAITFLSTSAARFATRVALRVTWPAAADPASANTQSAEMFVALDRN
jgi:uncharacterized protein (TIGR02598 family)